MDLELHSAEMSDSENLQEEEQYDKLIEEIKADPTKKADLLKRLGVPVMVPKMDEDVKEHRKSIRRGKDPHFGSEKCL